MPRRPKLPRQHRHPATPKHGHPVFDPCGTSRCSYFESFHDGLLERGPRGVPMSNLKDKLADASGWLADIASMEYRPASRADCAYP